MKYSKNSALGEIVKSLDEKGNEWITINGMTKYNGTIACEPFVWEMNLREKGFVKLK